MNEGDGDAGAPPAGIRRALLLGEDHPELGAMGLVAPAPGVALAVSAGHFPKLQPSVGANEDAAASASDGTTTLLAVADGHNGFAAARRAIVAIHDSSAELVAAGDPPAVVAAALRLAARTVTGDPTRDVRASGTALTVAAVAGSQVAAGTFGDTVAVLIGGRRARVVGKTTSFLTSSSSSTRKVYRARLAQGGALVLMSDGAYGFHGREWTQRVAGEVGDRDAAGAADAVVGAAFRAGAGDHVAVVVYRDPG